MNFKMQPRNATWIVRDSPYSKYVHDLSSFDPRLVFPDPKPLSLGVSWENRPVKVHVITFRDGKPAAFLSPTDSTSDFLSKYLSHTTETPESLGTAYIFEGMNQDVATILGNHFWIDPSFFTEYQRTASTASKTDTCSSLLATGLTTQSYITIPYRDMVGLPEELIGYFGLACSATGRAISTTRINGEFDKIASANRKCLIWSERKNGSWNLICDPPLHHITIKDQGLSKGYRYPVMAKPVDGGYVDFLPVNIRVQQLQGPPRTSLAEDLCFYVKNCSALPSLTNDPDTIALFIKKIVASHYSRHLDHLHRIIIRSQLPMRRHYDFAALDLADVEANWSSCQTLEKRLHQYCYDLEYILAQLRIPLQRPDFAHAVSWTDVNVDFQMLHYQFENARDWVSKINSNITGLTGIAGNRQAFREQQLSLNAANRTRNITSLGLLFVPLAYVATLFSMSGDFAPGGDRFWLYFAIALPVTTAVFAVYRGLDCMGKLLVNK